MTPLRILMVIDYKLAYLGGAQTAFIHQANALAAAGHAVTIAAPDASTLADQVAADVTCWDSPVTLVIPSADLPVIRNTARTRDLLGRKLTGCQTDVVITHSEFGLAAAVLQVAAERGIRTLHVVHTFFWRGPLIAALAAPVVTAAHSWVTGTKPPRRRLCPRRLDSALRGMTLAVAHTANLVISPSHHQASALRRAGLPHVSVISNTSPDTSCAPLIRSSAGPLRLVWAARFAPEKRLEVVLAAMRIVNDVLGCGAVVLDVAGGEGGADSVGVRFHGRVSSVEIALLLDDAHAAVVTSLGFDNQPMIAVEAFRAGRPVIVSDPMLAAEFGAAAIPASDSTAAGLARTIIRLARDRDRLRGPATAARQYARYAGGPHHSASLENAILLGATIADQAVR